MSKYQPPKVMNQVKTHYNRRSFLKVSAAAGGGIVIGFSWLTRCKPPAGAEVVGVPSEWFDINSFIKIGDTGMITIYSPNPEIGQNVKTSMPLIVAEELDANWEHVNVEQAPLNTEIFTRQLAGGSQSIRQGWESLRMAGAVGKRMLMEAVAKEWGVSVTDLKAEASVISEKNGERTMTYGEIASKAAGLTVPEEVDLKDPKDFSLIGTNVKNVDGKRIVGGEPLFGLDFKREGMLISMIEHPPAFGMQPESFNESEIKAMPGIKDAFIVDTSVPEEQWSDTNAFTQLVAIVGENTWQVMKAKKALKVKWALGEDESFESSEDHTSKLKEALESGESRRGRTDGDPDAAFAAADRVIERTYSAPFLPHNTMEPMNFFADVTADKAELIGPIQTPEFLELSISGMLGMPVENITIDMTRMGGGFGRRLYGHFGVEAVAISKKIGKPVKLIYTREDDMSQGTYRPAYRVKYRAGLDKDNNLVAFAVKGAGIPGSPVFPNRYPAGTVDHYRAENVGIATNISTGAWRAPRSNFIAGAEQSFLDEIAEAVGKDPIDFRLELFDRAINNPVGEKNDYDPERYAGVLKLVKEKSNWGQNMPGVHRGVAAYYCHNSYVAQVLDIEMESGQPKVKKVWCAVDCGIVINMEGAKNQIEGGIIDGIGHAMYSELTFQDGTPDQTNFDRYKLIRHSQAPEEIEVFFVENGIDPTGLGEPSLPPIMGALSNAMYRATGQRYYHQPFTTADQEQESIEII